MASAAIDYGAEAQAAKEPAAAPRTTGGGSPAEPAVAPASEPPGMSVDYASEADQAKVPAGPEYRIPQYEDVSRGIPVYGIAPLPPGATGFREAPAAPPPGAPPRKPEPWEGTVLGETLINPARQAGSAVYGAAAGANELLANAFDLWDVAAQKISDLTGMEKGTLVKHIAEWARQQAEAQRQREAELAGGRQDLPSKVNRMVAGAAANLPTSAVAVELGGAGPGMAMLGAVQHANEGWGRILQAAGEGYFEGKGLQFMGPANRPIRLFGAGLMTYLKLRAQGVDNETAMANALMMGGMSAAHPGGAGVREAAQTLREQGTGPIFKSTLDPTKQAAVDYLRQQDVPLTPSTLTGNRYLRGMEERQTHLPVGGETGSEFHRATGEALGETAGKLTEEAYPESPQTPYSAGEYPVTQMDKQISDLHEKETAAYQEAWAHAGDPKYTRSVQVTTKQEPVLGPDGKATGEMRTVPVMRNVNMPVDIRWLKAFARSELKKYAYGLSRKDMAASKTAAFLEAAVKGGDHITAQQAEEGLKALKAESRTAESPALRDAAQGTAARLIPKLQATIDNAVAATGEDAIAGLKQGRQLHYEKMRVKELQDKLRDAPVQNFEQLLAGRDSNVDLLRRVTKQVEDSGPMLGRALLDRLFEQATQEGGWERAQGILAKWKQIGPQTKAILFPNAEMRAALDKFFLGQKLVATRANPSGTALVTGAGEATWNPLKWVEGGLGSWLFYKPSGIRFLTGLKTNPPQTAAEGARVRAEARRIAGRPEEPPPETPGGPGGGAPPPGTPPAGGGAGGGAAPALPKVGDTVEVSPPSLAPMFGGKEPWHRGTVSELRRDPVTGETAVIIKGPGGREMVGTPGYWRPVNPNEPPAGSAPAGGGPGGGTGTITIHRDLHEELQGIADAAVRRVMQRGGMRAGLNPEDIKDMVQWGAAKMGQGIIAAGEWRAALIAQFPQFAKDLRKKEVTDPIYQEAKESEIAKNVKDWKPGMKLQDIHPLTREIIKPADPAAGLEVPDVMRYLESMVKKHLGQIPADAPDKVKVARIQQQARKEFRDAMKQQVTGANWYDAERVRAEQLAEKAHPEFATNDTQRILSTLYASILGKGQTPKEETYYGMHLYDEYLKSGGPNNRQAPLWQPGKAKETGEGVRWPGRGVTDGIEAVNKYVKLLGEDGLADFITNEQKGSDILKLNPAADVADSDEKFAGAMILGPKLGPYFLGNMGIKIKGTGTPVDSWMTQALYRYLGDMFNTKGEPYTAPRTPADRQRSQDLDVKLAKEFGLKDADSAQSVRWHYEKGLYRLLGAPSKQAYTRGQGLERYLMEKGIP